MIRKIIDVLLGPDPPWAWWALLGLLVLLTFLLFVLFGAAGETIHAH